MTTIAFKGGILAADRRSTVSTLGSSEELETVVYDNSTRKIAHVQCADGFVRMVAVSGISSYLGRVERWVADGMQGEHPAPGEAMAIIFSPPGLLHVVTEYGVDEFTIADFAFGSGAAFALGAMSAGASAIEAVKIAAKYDAGTGSEVNFVTIDAAEVQSA